MVEIWPTIHVFSGIFLTGANLKIGLVSPYLRQAGLKPLKRAKAFEFNPWVAPLIRHETAPQEASDESTAKSIR